MIEYKTGDITREGTEALVNTVNCVGFMGKGVALRFKEVFPENFKVYKEACEHEQVQPGRMLVFETGSPVNPRYIINFPTKRHWRGKSRMEDIESGLRALTEEIRHRGIRSIAIPPLGSGFGGLEWTEVRPRIEAALLGLDDLLVTLYEPSGAFDNPVVPRNRPVPKMTAGRAALIGLINRYLTGLLDPFVTLLEVQKLMYFMQEAGENLRLRFEKGHYGPYAGNLGHVLERLEGHFISGYDGRDIPGKMIALVPGATLDAEVFLEAYPKTRVRFERVSDLVDGFESSFGLELLSTVHWVASPSMRPAEVIDHVYAWNEQKRQFSERQIRLALEILQQKGWLERWTSL